jgi:signal transduction histidine kinase
VDHFTRLKRQVVGILVVSLLIIFLVGFSIFIGLEAIGLDGIISFPATIIVVILLSVGGARWIANYTMQPLYVLWKSVTLLSDKSQVGPPPQAEDLKLGRTMVTTMLQQLYQLISTTEQTPAETTERRTSTIQSANIVSHMPLPLFVFNKDLLVTNASDIGLSYCAVESAQLFGKPLTDSINLEFPSDRTLETWIDDCKQNKVTDTAYWERVRVVLPTGGDAKYRRCDIAAHYNRDNPSGTEFIITMFDRTEQYQQDDNNMSFVALAVHELRTPLTMLRGYIEVFVDELDDQLDDEMKDFLQKMDMSAKQLNAFVGNILNVSKVDENALTLHLAKANWKQVLTETIQSLQPKAKVHGIELELQVAPDLPDVAIDKVSVLEIISNLVDNAIKYSGEQKKIIIISSLGKDGFVHTTVQDYGLGIPETVVPHIFEKFYRNHRTKTQVGGTGLGLYLAKSLVTAHGGQIWVSSKVGEGSTFGFSLQPFEMLEKAGEANEDGLNREAHGWIKNHSMYRR